MIEDLTCASFEPHLNTTFRIQAAEGEPLALELVEATDKTPAGFPGEQFSLIFRGPLEPPLEQQIYALEHDALGRLELFLVPIDRRKKGYLYEAYFNRAAELDDDE